MRPVRYFTRGVMQGWPRWTELCYNLPTEAKPVHGEHSGLNLLVKTGCTVRRSGGLVGIILHAEGGVSCRLWRWLCCGSSSW